MSGVGDRKAALAVLGLAPGAGDEAVGRAFRQAVKRAHPDRGGDARRLQQIVEAYRWLQHEAEAPKPSPAKLPIAGQKPPVVEITARQAVFGADISAQTRDGRQVNLSLAPGARPGQLVQAGSESFVVQVRQDGVTVRGDDLWISHAVEDGVLTDGGRLTVDTPCGRRCFWINRKTAARRLVRLPGDGLPAAEGRRQGDLFIRLTPRAARAESPAQVLLRRFAATWAA